MVEFVVRRILSGIESLRIHLESVYFTETNFFLTKSIVDKDKKLAEKV